MSSDVQKAWNWKVGALLSAIGLAAGGCILVNKYRARPHDNIPMVTPEHFHPILGHLPFIIRMRKEHPNGFLYEIHRKMGYPSVSSHSHLLQVIFIIHPAHVKHVFETNFEKAGRTEKLKYRGYELFGDGIFTANGEQWKFHRKVYVQSLPH